MPAQEDALWPPSLDLEGLAERTPEPPKFILPDWLPCGYATLFAGHGGVGKSGIALHLAVCVAAGVPFFGMELQARRVLYLSCEDRESVLHWRLARISQHLGIRLADLRGKLEVIDLVGAETIIWEKTREGCLMAPWFELQKRMRVYQTEVLFVDGISDTYGGNENAKAEVKRYVNSLVRLIDPERGAIILIGHIAKPAASGLPTTEGYSGTTGWHNSVRARWYLYPETESAEDGGRPTKTGDLMLELQKSNLGQTDQTIRFQWDKAEHLFVGQSASLSQFDRKHQERTEQDAIIASFRATEQHVPAATTGRRTAYHVLAAQSIFPASLKGDSGPKKRRFWRHIEDLRASGILREVSIRRADRHSAQVLELVSKGNAGNAGNA